MTAIENGVSCLKSLGHEKEMEFGSWIAHATGERNMNPTQEHLDTYAEIEEMGSETIKALTKDKAVVGNSPLVSPSNGSSHKEPYNVPYMRLVISLGNNKKDRRTALRLAYIYNKR